MVDVGMKDKTERVAVATGSIKMSKQAISLIRSNEVPKGDVLAAARLAAIMAAKKTPDLIPLCHPISLSGVDAEISLTTRGAQIRVTVKTVDRTGVEMEALAGVAAAALTIYDMLKSTDRSMEIQAIALDHKSGGRSGTFDRRAAKPRDATLAKDARRRV